MNTKEEWPHQRSLLKLGSVCGGASLAAAPPSVRSGGQLGHSEAWELPEIFLDNRSRGLTLGRGMQLSAEGYANTPTSNQGGEKLEKKGRAWTAGPRVAEQREVLLGVDCTRVGGFSPGSQYLEGRFYSSLHRPNRLPRDGCVHHKHLKGQEGLIYEGGLELLSRPGRDR